MPTLAGSTLEQWACENSLYFSSQFSYEFNLLFKKKKVYYKEKKKKKSLPRSLLLTQYLLPPPYYIGFVSNLWDL